MSMTGTAMWGRPAWLDLGVSYQVAIAVCIIQICCSTVYYFTAFKPTYMRLMNAPRRPAFTR